MAVNVRADKNEIKDILAKDPYLNSIGFNFETIISNKDMIEAEIDDKTKVMFVTSSDDSGAVGDLAVTLKYKIEVIVNKNALAIAEDALMQVQALLDGTYIGNRNRLELDRPIYPKTAPDSVVYRVIQFKIQTSRFNAIKTV